MSDFHKSAAWIKARNRFKAVCRSVDAPCAICLDRGDIENSAIDYLRPRTPRSFEVDHRLPVWSHPHLALVAENFRACHARCNRVKGHDAPVQQEWIRPDW